jgi:hypothetical protein
MPGTVSDVSATLVASTIRRPGWGRKARCCSAVDRRAYSGSSSTSAGSRPRSASAVSRISRSPLKKTRMSPDRLRISSSTASPIASVWSRSLPAAAASSSSGSTSGR